MTEKSAKSLSTVETQQERWLKYGGNVVLSSVVVILLAALVVYAAQRRPIRIDTTSSGLYSLTPQTVHLIQNLKSPVRLVSLYTKSKPPAAPDDQDQPKTDLISPDQAAQTVSDLLDEYANKGKDITVETIDPVTSPSKVDDLIGEVEAKYGGEVKKYSDFVTKFDATNTQISGIADPEVKKVENLPLTENTDPDVLNTLRYAFITVENFPKNLADLQEALRPLKRQKPPDYKGAADAINDRMSSLSGMLDAVITNFGVLQKRGGLPPEIAAYMTSSLPNYQNLKKIVDDTVTSYKGLGELKLDTLRSALRERNTILVMGDKEWRSINYDQVWHPTGMSMASEYGNAPPPPRFAGEQQVTSAILSLTTPGPKPKVVFVRAGGPPLTQSMSFMGPDAPLSFAAARLALYNYDVQEKDLTGQFAAQSQGQAPPEPSDDDIKDATWIVWGIKGQGGPFGPGPSIGPQVADHLKSGGSAVILSAAGQDGVPEALADWGITIRTDAMILHEKVDVQGGNATDIDRALGQPQVLDLHDYGDHSLAKPLAGLDCLLYSAAPVEIKKTGGVNAVALLPIPTAPEAPRSWGAVNYNPDPQHPEIVPAFNPATDIAGPLFAGAAAERDRGGRVVVIGSAPSVNNEFLDPAALMAQFPGNGELFTNSVFWASHQDTLIDISPAAMGAGRIGYISDHMLTAWHVALLGGLPGLVLVLGAGVYMKRRD